MCLIVCLIMCLCVSLFVYVCLGAFPSLSLFVSVFVWFFFVVDRVSYWFLLDYFFPYDTVAKTVCTV